MKDNRRQFLKTFTSACLAAGLAPKISAQNATTCQNTNTIIPFYGKHQAGITSPLQKHIYFISLDLHTQDIEKIKNMFKTWTKYSARLTHGQNIQPYSQNRHLPPSDTGESDSLNPHALTLTFGISPSFFDKLNIKAHCPSALKELPHFPRDQIQTAYQGGDICIQACANDLQVAFHAVRNLVRSARLYITPRWAQTGFNAFDDQQTPRNLFAFKDGTGNPKDEELNNTLWIEDGWAKNGSYLVVRKIKMFLETWDRTSLKEQENTFGRYRDTGAGFGLEHEHDTIDLSAQPEDAHVFLAQMSPHKILRRSYSYLGGIDQYSQFDSGLLFIAFMKNPEFFIDIQKQFGNIDKLNEYITHIGSALFLCLPGIEENQYLGQPLFERL